MSQWLDINYGGFFVVFFVFHEDCLVNCVLLRTNFETQIQQVTLSALLGFPENPAIPCFPVAGRSLEWHLLGNHGDRGNGFSRGAAGIVPTSPWACVLALHCHLVLFFFTIFQTSSLKIRGIPCGRMTVVFS